MLQEYDIRLTLHDSLKYLMGVATLKSRDTVVSWQGRDTQWNKEKSLTQVVQSNKYYKSRAVGMTSEVDLTTDQDVAELWRA